MGPKELGEGRDTSSFRQGGGLDERYQVDDTAVVSLLTLEARRGIQGVTISRRKEAPKGMKVACTVDTRYQGPSEPSGTQDDARLVLVCYCPRSLWRCCVKRSGQACRCYLQFVVALWGSASNEDMPGTVT
jgi:hypothetical protein